MSLNAVSIAFLTPLLMLTSIQSKAMELNLKIPEESALTLFTDSDWDTMKTHAKKVLNEDSDGDTQQWQNNETGHSGNITALSTNTKNGMLCRNTQFINIAGDSTSTTLVNLCKQGDKWFEETARTTATVKHGGTNEQPQSILYNSSQPQSPTISKKVLSQTSERCRQLSQNMKLLVGDYVLQ